MWLNLKCSFFLWRAQPRQEYFQNVPSQFLESCGSTFLWWSIRAEWRLSTVHYNSSIISESRGNVLCQIVRRNNVIKPYFENHTEKRKKMIRTLRNRSSFQWLCVYNNLFIFSFSLGSHSEHCMLWPTNWSFARWPGIKLNCIWAKLKLEPVFTITEYIFWA